MSYPLTPRAPRRAVVTSAFGTLLGLALVVALSIAMNFDSNIALAASESSADAGNLEVPSAASRLLFEDLEAPIRPQSYPGLPTADPMTQDPEQIREELRTAVERALAETPELAATAILVHVTSLRRARLRGIVGDESTRVLAEIIAAGVTGISGVDNGLSVEAEQD